MIDRVRTLATAGALIVGFTTGIASAETKPAAPAASATEEAATRTAVFAGGCFWCVEADFDKVDGVLSTVSGYTGGTTEDPTYKQVTYGDTGHYEAVEITYDPAKVDYRTLVDHLLRTIDPTDDGGQFCDRGDSYRPAIFVADEAERSAAEAALAEAAEVIEAPLATPILDQATFYNAEEYHQDYYLKNPLRYRYYRYSCGRDARIDEVWKNAEEAS